jgi:hypothetical protein
MKDDVYPEDIKAIPVKRIPPAAQRPYVVLARERHRLWSELTALEALGYRIGKNVEIPVRALVEGPSRYGTWTMPRQRWALVVPRPA